MRLQQLILETDIDDQEKTISLNIDMGEPALLEHQLTLEFYDANDDPIVPTTGTITVTFQVPNGTVFHDIVDGILDVTDTFNWAKRCQAHVSAFKFTPNGIDAGIKFKAALISSF